jgi:hypothetical protein
VIGVPMGKHKEKDQRHEYVKPNRRHVSGTSAFDEMECQQARLKEQFFERAPKLGIEVKKAFERLLYHVSKSHVGIVVLLPAARAIIVGFCGEIGAAVGASGQLPMGMNRRRRHTCWQEAKYPDNTKVRLQRESFHRRRT